MPKIRFKDLNIVIQASSGSEFSEVAARNPDMPIRFGCRQGNCGTCAIQIIEGASNLTKKSPLEVQTLQKKHLGEDCRLACQCALNGDVTINPINIKK